MAGTIATPRGTAFAVRASNGFSNGPEDTGLHANARRHTVASANSLFKGTVVHANARHCTVPVRLITRRSAVAERAAGCRSEGVERACPTFVPQLLWDCPEPQGASGTGMGALPAVLRAVRNLGEPSGTQEWRLLWDRGFPRDSTSSPATRSAMSCRVAPLACIPHNGARRGGLLARQNSRKRTRPVVQ